MAHRAAAGSRGFDACKAHCCVGQRRVQGRAAASCCVGSDAGARKATRGGRLLVLLCSAPSRLLWIVTTAALRLCSSSLASAAATSTSTAASAGCYCAPFQKPLHSTSSSGVLQDMAHGELSSFNFQMFIRHMSIEYS